MRHPELPGGGVSVAAKILARSTVRGRPERSLIVQPFHPGGIPVPPANHRRPRHPDPLGDLGVRHPIGGQQHDPGPLRQTGTDR